MAAIVTFDPAAWAQRYPEFATCPAPLALAYFNEATLYIANDGTGPVNDPVRLLAVLWMVTAHIAALNFGVNGEAPAALVGRLGSASEGSVSVSTDMPALPGSAAWWAQTKYGFSAWQATAAYRTMQYRPAPCAPVYVGPFGGGYNGGCW